MLSEEVKQKVRLKFIHLCIRLDILNTNLDSNKMQYDYLCEKYPDYKEHYPLSPDKKLDCYYNAFTALIRFSIKNNINLHQE